MGNYLKIFLVGAAAAFFGAACSVDDNVEAGRFGVLDFSSISHSVETVTRAGDAVTRAGDLATRAGETDDYTVRLLRKKGDGEAEVFARPLSQCVGAEAVLVGKYRMEISSAAACPAAAWDTPWYVGATEEFEIQDGLTTSVGNVNCTLGNVKVSVGYGESLIDVLDKGSVVVGVAIGENKLEFPYGEVRNGYFSVGEAIAGVLPQSAEMTVTFEGMVDTAPIVSVETITVAPGQWQRLRFVLEGDESFRLVVTASQAGQLEEGGQWF